MHRDYRALHILHAAGTKPAEAGAEGTPRALPESRWNRVKVVAAESLREWSGHNDARLGASLAFYTLFSLTPLVLVAVSIGGLVANREAAENQVVQQIRDLVGPQGAAGIRLLLSGTRNTAHGTLATVFGIGTLLFGASSVLVELRDALNTIWEIRPAPATGWRSVLALVKDRLFSFALVLAVGFLLLVSLVMNAWIAAAGKFFAGFLPAPEILLHAANEVFSFFVVAALFSAIYKVLPEIRIEWADVLLGGAVTSLLFTCGKLLIGLYLGKESFASTYGAAASLVILIVWVYYSSQIFFLGAEFTRSYATHYGSKPGLHRSPAGAGSEARP